MKSSQPYVRDENGANTGIRSYICSAPSERYKEGRRWLVRGCSISPRDLRALAALFPSGAMFLCLKEYCLLCELMICLEDASLRGEGNRTAFMMYLSSL